MGTKGHKRLSRGLPSARCAILTVSDKRTTHTDLSGNLAERIFKRAGHKVVYRKLVKNSPSQIGSELRRLLRKPVDFILTIGGTGVSKKDLTIEVAERFIHKRLEGFGELFRRLSYKEIGTASMLSRSLMGVTKDRLILCTPGSPPAVRLSLEKIVLPELKHILWELRYHT
jgi:molybdenum cofactor biosynthesis protein B